MSYPRGRRRYDPRADERREREQKDEERRERAKAKLARLLRQFRRVPLRGEAAQHAWGEPQIRSYTIGRLSNGDAISVIIRGRGRDLYLQEPGHAGWSFSRLVPRYQVPRSEEVSERDVARRRTAESRRR